MHESDGGFTIESDLDPGYRKRLIGSHVDATKAV